MSRMTKEEQEEIRDENERLCVALKLAQTRAGDLEEENARLCEMIIAERTAHKELDEAIASENARLRAENIRLTKLCLELDVARSTISALESDKVNLAMNLEHIEADLEAVEKVLDWACSQCGYEPGWEECAKCPVCEWRYRDAMPLSDIVADAVTPEIERGCPFDEPMEGMGGGEG